MIRKMDIRKIVLNRLEQMNMTTNALSAKLGDKVPRTNLYSWLNKKTHINSYDLGQILDALDIDLVPRR